MQTRCSVSHRRQRWKIRERFALIPEGRGIKIVRAIVRMAVLHRMFQVPRECYGIIAMPPVAAISAASPLRIHNQRRSIKMMRKRNRGIASTEIPTAQKVIFRAGAIDDRLTLVIDEYHVVAFAHPAIRVLQNAQRDAHQMSAAARFHVSVIIFAIWIQLRPGIRSLH